MCAEPYCLFFLNTFKYVSAHENNNPDKCFNNIEKEEYEYSTFPNKVGITKYSIVTNSNDSVTLRLMTEHDLAMLYE